MRQRLMWRLLGLLRKQRQKPRKIKGWDLPWSEDRMYSMSELRSSFWLAQCSKLIPVDALKLHLLERCRSLLMHINRQRFMPYYILWANLSHLISCVLSSFSQLSLAKPNQDINPAIGKNVRDLSNLSMEDTRRPWAPWKSDSAVYCMDTWARYIAQMASVFARMRMRLWNARWKVVVKNSMCACLWARAMASDCFWMLLDVDPQTYCRNP